MCKNFRNFDYEAHRFDELYQSIFQTLDFTKACEYFVGLILSIFLGNAVVERGFYSNKNFLEDNFQE